MSEADRIASYGYKEVPVLVMGDLNSTASGPHLPQRDWRVMPPHDARQKGKNDRRGRWSADTGAVDMLVGEWPREYEWGDPRA